mmetsp:Transcript_44085/g.134225  ORF Transcript_44085/g.134225 Transcript_44085/m.134225 type:complete len:170 (-) Transcript_44085:793-1302(-)
MTEPEVAASAATRVPASPAPAPMSITSSKRRDFATVIAAPFVAAPNSPSVVSPPSHALHLRIDLRRRPRVDPFLRRAAVRAALMHVLYSRGILPCAAGEVLEAHRQSQQVASCGGSGATAVVGTKRRRQSRGDRKFAKVGKELSNILEDIDRAFGLDEESGGSTTGSGS